MGPKVHNARNYRPESPADRVVAAFGARRVAEIAGVTTEAVRKWQRRRATAGGGGLIPAQYQATLLNAALAEGIELTAQDLIGEPY